MKIFGIQFTHTSSSQILQELPGVLAGKKGQTIFTPNPEILLKQSEDSEFKDILESANYLIPDGIGLYIAAQMTSPPAPLLLGEGSIIRAIKIIIRIFLLPYFFFNLFFRRAMLYKKYGERICGSDLTKLIVEYAVANKIRITILDPYFPKDLPKVASQKSFEKNLAKKFPGLLFDFNIYNLDKKSEIISEMKQSDSQILFSTLGMKTQEQSVIDIMSECPNIKLGLGVGSSFDYFVGFQKRAPKIFSSLGLEWFYRLATSPNKTRQLSKIWNAIFVFLWKVIKK